MVLSTERICESLLRIHDTFCVTGNNRLILIISSTSTRHYCKRFLEILYSISCKNKIWKKYAKIKRKFLLDNDFFFYVRDQYECVVIQYFQYDLNKKFYFYCNSNIIQKRFHIVYLILSNNLIFTILC